MATNAPINYTPNNTFIFSFVRMNPPTPGHLVLIKTMIDKAIQFGTEKVYVLTSSSLDGKNPLPCNSETIPKPKNKGDVVILDNLTQMPDLTYKSSILTNMITSYKQQLIEAESDLTKKTQIENLQIIVLCSSGSPFGFIFNIINNDFISKGVSKVNLYFIVGRDRADFLDTILDYFITQPAINSVDGEILGREGMQQLLAVGNRKRKVSEINPSEYSASFIRGLVKDNDFESFQQVYSLYLDSNQIQHLYDTIKIGIQMKTPPPKGEDDYPKTKYFINDRANAGKYIKRNLPKINTLGGRKRRITRKNKINKRTTKKNKKIRTRRKSRRYR
jgi:hypothetical protein